MNKPMTDKTQEELEKILDKFFLTATNSTSKDPFYEGKMEARRTITHYINKYYVPRDDGLEV